MSILFTTGATVTFRSLVDKVTSPEFLEFLGNCGFSTVALQYGNETNPTSKANISKEYFSAKLAEKNVVGHFGFDLVNETNDKTVTTFRNAHLTFQVFAFSHDISQYIACSDLVVSHAGTGSILDTLRLKKPLIVVTNDSLMDGHQAEIAARFEAENYLVKVSEEEMAAGKLQQKIQEWKNGHLTFAVLADPPAGVLAHVISGEVEKIQK